MNKVLLLIRHEFIQAIIKPGYIIATLLLPVLTLLGIGISAFVEYLTESAPKDPVIIGYVDQGDIISGNLDEGFISILPYQTLEEAREKLLAGEITEFIVIPEDYLSTGTIDRYIQKKEVFPPLITSNTIKVFMTLNLIKDQVPPEIINSIVSPLDLEVIRLDEYGELSDDQSGWGNLVIPAVYAFLLTMTFQYGSGALISGLGEEKESRLIEVLYSSVSSRQLMTGKILALGAAGLLQVAVWLTSAPLLIVLSAESMGGFLQQIQISPIFIILAVIYYLLGYLLFAIMSVTLGSICSNSSEAHNYSMIYTLFCYVPIWFAGFLIEYPDNPIWVALTIFPVTAPIQTLIRLGVSDVPFWQIATSLSVLTISVIAGIFFADKVFKTFMLMYGKRPRLGEIFKALKAA